MSNCVIPVTTENDVKLALAQEEAVEILQESGIILHTLPPSILVTAGMDLEIQQYVQYHT